MLPRKAIYFLRLYSIGPISFDVASNLFGSLVGSMVNSYDNVNVWLLRSISPLSRHSPPNDSNLQSYLQRQSNWI